MHLKAIVEEDFTNYKNPAMLLGTVSCTGKCCVEAGIPRGVCINNNLQDVNTCIIEDDSICSAYLGNPITEAIIFGGLEPFDQFDEVLNFIHTLRKCYDCPDYVVIYTGYYPNEIEDKLEQLEQFPNIIVKFGRFIPNDKPVFDEVLGVELASSNQYAVKIS